MTASNSIRLGLRDDRRAAAGPALTVALASSDLVKVDQHFGSATRFGIYRVTADRADLLSVARFDAAEHDGNEGKLPAKIAALQGCVAVFCQAAGGSAVRQLLAVGIQPIKLDAGATVGQTLTWMRKEIKSPTLPWVIKALQTDTQREDPGRFDAMETEGWNG
jgi:nitrogen fixation protein NifX